MGRVDARLMEMQFLASLDRVGSQVIERPYTVDPETQMIYSLASDGYINDGSDPSTDVASGTRIDLRRGLPVKITISHKGRVRLSELQQQLKTGRDRDETGLLWAKRHLQIDLPAAVFSASEETPLSVVFIDMNGLKSINDARGHAAGDDAIRAFFQAILATLGQHGEAYRNGGDEVVVIMPSVTDEQARKFLDVFVRQLGKGLFVLGEAKVEITLTASCGSASTTNPEENALALLDRADKAQYRAKTESKKSTPRVSAIAIGDGEVVTYPPDRLP